MGTGRWYKCGTGATGCQWSEADQVFFVKEEEYDGWTCPHSKFCKDNLIRLTWLARHRRLMTLLPILLLLSLTGAGLLYYLQRPVPPMEVSTMSNPPVQPTVAQPDIKIPNDSDRIADKLREKLKPSIPQDLSLLPIQKFYFDVNKSKLDAKLHPYLAEAVKELSKPEYKDKHLAVVGYADAKGTDKTNCPLSEARSNTVVQELRKQIRLTMTALGLCSTRPIGDNETPEGQQMNRRVELWIFDLQK